MWVVLGVLLASLIVLVFLGRVIEKHELQVEEEAIAKFNAYVTPAQAWDAREIIRKHDPALGVLLDRVVPVEKPEPPKPKRTYQHNKSPYARSTEDQARAQLYLRNLEAQKPDLMDWQGRKTCVPK